MEPPEPDSVAPEPDSVERKRFPAHSHDGGWHWHWHPYKHFTDDFLDGVIQHRPEPPPILIPDHPLRAANLSDW